MANRRRRRASTPFDPQEILGQERATAAPEPQAEDAEFEVVRHLPARREDVPVPRQGVSGEPVFETSPAFEAAEAPQDEARAERYAPSDGVGEVDRDYHEEAAQEAARFEEQLVSEEPPTGEEQPMNSGETGQPQGFPDLESVFAEPMATAEGEALADDGTEEGPPDEEPDQGQQLQVVAAAQEAYLPGWPYVGLNAGGDDEKDPLEPLLASMAAGVHEEGQAAILRLSVRPARSYVSDAKRWRAEIEAGETPKRRRPSGGSGLNTAGAIAWKILKGIGWVLWVILRLIGKVIQAWASDGKAKSAAKAKGEEKVYLSDETKEQLKELNERLKNGPFLEGRLQLAVAETVEPEDAEWAQRNLGYAVESMTAADTEFETKHQRLSWRPSHPIDALVGLQRSRPSADLLLSTDEAALLAHIPSTDPHGLIVDRSELRPLAPRHMPPAVKNPYAPPKGVVPIGLVNKGSHDQRCVGVDVKELDKHAVIFGRSGTGKSVLANNLALGIARTGYPIVLLDPHGELADATRDAIAIHCPERLDDIVMLDVADEYPPAINPLDIHSEAEVTGAVDRVVKMMSLYKFDEETAPRAMVFAKQALRALCYANLVLPEEHKLTLLHVRRFLSNQEFRSLVMTTCSDPAIREIYGDPDNSSFDAMSEKEQGALVMPILRTFDAIAESPAFRRMFATTDKLNFARLISEKRIVLIKMARFAGESEALGLSVATMILPAVLSSMAVWGRRANNPDGVGCRIIIDEAPAVLKALGGLEAILAEARKYDASVIALAQHPKQLPENLRKELYANTSNKIALKLDKTSVAGFNEALSTANTELTETDIASLPNFTGYADLVVNSPRGDKLNTGPFAVHFLPPPPLPSAAGLEGVRETVLKNSRQAIAVHPDVVDARLKGDTMFDGPMLELIKRERENPQSAANIIDALQEQVQGDFAGGGEEATGDAPADADPEAAGADDGLPTDGASTDAATDAMEPDEIPVDETEAPQDQIPQPGDERPNKEATAPRFDDGDFWERLSQGD